MGAVFTVDAAATRFSGLTGSGTVKLGLAGPYPLKKLTVGVADASSTFGSVIADGDAAAPFEKIGTGTLTYTGSTTYSGTTAVSAGKLVVNGVTSTSPMTVSAGATLGGSGTVGGVTTIAGIRSPGNSPGVQTFASTLKYQAGSGLLWELAANTTGTVSSDQIIPPIANLAGSDSTAFTMAFDGAGSTVDWANAFWNVNRSWLVYDLGSGVTTGFGNLTLGGSLLDSLGNTLSPTGRGYFTLGQGGQDVVLNFTAVPEPSTAALAAIGIAAAAGLAARRRKG